MTESLLHVTPLPPARNGIADYASILLDNIRARTNSLVLSDTIGAVAPRGVRVVALDAAEPKHFKGRLPVYQIGNNWQHTETLRLALKRPGLVVLHDLQLFYLYESLGLTSGEMADLVRRSNPFLSDAFAARLSAKTVTPKLPYMLASMTADLVSESKRILVHSRYARNLIERHLGEEVADRVDVVPHFAIPSKPRDRDQTRRRLGVDSDRFLIVTAGFATKAKQLDMLAQALVPLVRQDRRYLWIHAGSAGDEYYNLSSVLKEYAEVEAVTRITGYLSESALDDHVAAADLLINLRFPSVGESSGSLARALTSGVCALVTDTGGYSEYPSDAVLKLGLLDTHQTLAALIQALADNDDLRKKVGLNARAYAETRLSMNSYIEGFMSAVTRANAVKTVEPRRADVAVSDWVGPLEQLGSAFNLLGGGKRTGVDFARNPSNREPGIYVRRRS